jgi:hypothetical protein
VFEHLGLDREVVHCFFLFYAILLSSFSTGCVYIYTIELFGICALPILLNLYFLPFSWFPAKLGLALFGSLLFKLNLAFDVVGIFCLLRFIDSGFHFSTLVDLLLGLGLGGLSFLLYLQCLGILRFSISGFLAFFKCRNEGWYAWKRLLIPFLGPIFLENAVPFLALIPAVYWIFSNPGPLEILALILLGAEVFGVILQRGFFHYHYIALLPGVALVGAFSVKLIPWTDFSIWILLLYTIIRFKYSKKQFWPKLLEHQEIYNRLVDQLEDWEHFEIVRNSKVCWFAGWRFQFHLRHNLPPFSVFLQTLKFMMIMEPEDERKFFPDFPDQFYQRLKTHTPDLLVLEENELIHLDSLRSLGFQVSYLGTYAGRLKFFRLLPERRVEMDEVRKACGTLFVRYPGNFKLEFFNKMTPQFVEQCETEVTLVGENSSISKMEEFLKELGMKTSKMDEDDFLRRYKELEGTYFLVSEGRSISSYQKVHNHISNRFRIFKYT